MIIALHPQTDELLEELTNNGDRLFWDDVRTQEVNGAHTFEFTMLADSSAAQHFDQRGRFLAPAKNGGWHEYVIYDTETIYSTNEKFVYGIATYPELNKQKIMTPRKYNNWTLDQFSNHILQNTEWNAGKVEYSGTASLNVEQFMGAYDLLVLAQKAFTDAFEFNFRVEVDGNRVSGRYVDFVERLGSNNAKELVAGKDIVEMKRRVLSDRIITALFVVGPEPEEGQVRYTTTITDDAAFQRWNRDGRHIMDVFEITETETDSQGNDIPMGSARINALGRAELDRRIAAIIEYEITAAYLGHLYPYEDVSLGDTFRVINTDMEPPLYAEARAIAVAESISNPSLNTYTIGEIIEYEERDILAAFRNMQKVYGTRVVTQVSPPEPNVNIIWIKPAEDITKPNVAHVYDSQLGKWVAITPTEAFHVDADPAGAAAAALEDAKADATAKAEAAKQAALDAQEAELALAEERARAYADGVVSDEEAARIAQAEANLQAAKEDATKKANDAQGAAYIYADTAAEAARDAALASANAESALAEERARAYADGIVDDEEAARIAQAQATLAAAQVAASEAATAAQAAAKLYTDTLRTDLEAQIGDLEDALSNFETIIDSSFKDGIIQEVEALTIEKYRNTLNAEKADLDNRYSGIHGDSSLTGAPKTNLASAKTAYNNAHTNLLSTIASAIADGKTTTTEKQAVDAAFETYHGALGTLVTRFEEAVKAITAAKDAVVKADSLLNSEKERLTAIRRIFTSANSSLTLEYDLLDGNTHLEGTTARTNLDAAHSAYEAAYSAFIANIDAAIADTSITTAERAATLAATNNLETKQADFTRRLTAAQQIVAEEQALEAKQLAEQAEQAAADALEKADTALTDIVNKVDKSTYDDRVAELQAAITAGETASESLSIEARDAAIAAAKTYADGIRTELNTSVGSVSTALTNFQSVVTGTFKDGIIQEAEAQAIEKYKNIITTDKLELDNQYTKVYADSALTGTPKTNLKTAKDAYNTAHTNLLTSINSAIADGKTTETEKTDVDTKFAAYRTALGTLSTRLEEAITATTNKKTADAQAAAIAAAAIDAQTKATAAKDAAIAAANTKAEAEREIAKAYADGIVDDEEAARITAIGEALNTAAADAATKANAAATAAQEYADIAVGEAKTAADAEAARLADAALLAAQEYADTAAGTAEQAAILHANTKAEAERVLAEAYADGIVDDEEAARIADVNAKLAAAKTHADNAVAAVLASAKAYADEAAEAAQTAAEGVSLAEVALAEERAKAYADGIVDDEEAARIAQAAANLTAAQTHATNAANTALSSAKTYADSAADAAESAAIAAANTKAEAEREIAKAYADGLIDDEEAARIAAIGTALNTAAEDAATKAQAAAEAAQNYADIAVGEAKEAANTEAQRLANLALTSAKTYADTAATTAETAAKTHADAKAEAERVLAEAYADGLIDDEEEARIAAVNAALATARTDATTKANTALASAKTYADTAATAAKNAAITAANTKAEAEREIAKAYADGIVDDEEEARIAAINANLAAAKTYADSTAATALASSKTYADTAAANAKTAAENAANAETVLAEARAKAYADGIVDDEEEARIAALTAALSSAKADATSKANAAETAAKTYSDAIRTDLLAAVGDIEDALDLFEVDVNGAFKDGIIQQVEAKSIEKYKNTLDTEKLDFDNRYTKVYADTKLTGTPKTNLKTAKDAYNTAHSALISSINTAIADGKATAAEATDVNTKFTAYRTALGTLSTRIEEAITATVNKKAADAQAAAITAAATDAATKANAARDAAITAANTKAEAEREIAKAYADGIVDDEEAARIAAVTAAANAAALDATSKADAALAASKTYAETTATAAKNAAITAANAKAEAERVLAEAYADGIVDDEEAARIADVNAKLAAAKTYADTKKAEAISAAATHADTAATNAKNAAITAANTKAEAEREIAKAYADGIVDAEEDARITAITNALTTAAADAKAKADAAALAAQQHADAALANLEIGGRNYQPDITVGYTQSVNTVTVVGDNALQIDFKLNTPSSPYIFLPKAVKLTAGETYTISFYATLEREVLEGEAVISSSIRHGLRYDGGYSDRTAVLEPNVRTKVVHTFTPSEDGAPTMIIYSSPTSIEKIVRVEDFMLNKGDKALDYTPAPEDITAEAERLAGLAETAAKNYADAMKLALEQDIATVNTALTNFQTTVTGSFKDGVIQEAEAKAIEKYKNLLTAEKLDLDNRYTKMYGDAALTGTPKTNLKSAKDAYNTAHTNLINSINTAIADGKTTTTEKADVDAKFTAYRTALGTLSTRFEEASLAISTKKASDAKAEAIAAGLKMEDVNNALDGYVRTTTYTTDKNGLIQSINQNATAITQTDEQLALRATTAQFNALTQTVSNNTAAITVVSDAISLKADAESITVLQDNLEGVTNAVQTSEIRLNEVETLIQPGSIVDTVTNSVRFELMLGEKANAEDLAGYATQEALNGIIGEVDALGNEISGIEFGEFVTQAEVDQRDNAILTTISASSGVNLIKNSVGLAGLTYWLVTGNGEVSPTSSVDLASLGYHSGFQFDSTGTGNLTLKQDVAVMQGRPYTLSYSMQAQNSVGEMIVRVVDSVTGAVIDTGPSEIENYAGFGDYSFTIAEMPTTQITIEIIAPQGKQAIITAVMLNIGEVPFSWTTAVGELYNTTIKMDLQGLRVSQLEEDAEVGFTVMTPSKFAGYYNPAGNINESAGSSDEVFRMDKDEFVMKKANVKEEITMGNIKAILINSTARNGWAFVPNTTN